MKIGSFPENIAGFKLISVTDNESTHPGRGYSGQYLSAGIRFSIYTYSSGLSSIPDGIDSIVTRDQFKQSVDYLLSISPVATEFLSGEPSRRVTVGQTPLLHAVFTYPDTVTSTRESVWSHLYLTARYNHFIKIRCIYSVAKYPAPNYRIQKQFLELFCGMIQSPTDRVLAHRVAAPQLSDVSFPRDLLPLHFRSCANGIPISGGWGYSADDAVIIGENDSRALGWLPFDSEGLKLIFIEKRIQEELVCARAADDKCTDIRWNMLEQRSVNLDGKLFDVMTFEVSAITEKNRAALQAEYPRSAAAPFDNAAYWQKQSALRLSYVTDYWFHVKQSMSSLLQSLFNEFTAWHRDAAVNTGAVPLTLSGVAADGRQFIVQLTGISLSRAELHSFMKTILAAEHAIAYAAGSFLDHYGEQGELIEEINVVAASSSEYIQGFAALQRNAAGVITALGDFSRYEECTPLDCVQTSLLTGGASGAPSGESDRYLSMWRELRETAQFRQR